MNAIILVASEERKREITELLVIRGYETTEVANSIQAYSLLKEELFDLLIVDQDELTTEDFLLLQKIQQEKYHLVPVPLVFISSSIKKLRLLSENYTFKHFDYFLYPFNKEEIFLKLNSISTIIKTIDENILKFTLAVEQSPATVMITDINGSIEYVNKKFSELTGFSYEEAKGQNPRILKSGIQTVEFYKNMWETILAGKIWKGEILNRKKNGEIYWENSLMSPVIDNKGKIIFFVAIKEDITARKKAEEALTESEAKTKAILDSSLDSIIAMNQRGEINYINHATEKIFGYNYNETLGKELHSIIASPESKEKFLDSFAIFINSGNCKVIGRILELHATKKDGTRFPIELSVSSFKIKGEWNSVGMIRDITERKESEKKITDVINKLERSNSELDKFASIVSHDLKEPLRSIVTFSKILEDEHKEKLGDDGAEYLRLILESGRHMQSLINDLLEYSRIGHKKGTLVLTDMEKLFNLSIQNLDTAIRNSSATITHDPLPMIMVDAMQIIQLFQNLIGNALKFHNKEKLLIHISCKKQNDEYLFSIKDNGIGIDPKYLNKIFEMFERLHNRDSYPGTGIGLSICKKVVENHGGRIWVDSQIGVGSTFYFTIKETRNNMPD